MAGEQPVEKRKLVNTKLAEVNNDEVAEWVQASIESLSVTTDTDVVKKRFGKSTAAVLRLWKLEDWICELEGIIQDTDLCRQVARALCNLIETKPQKHQPFGSNLHLFVSSLRFSSGFARRLPR